MKDVLRGQQDMKTEARAQGSRTEIHSADDAREAEALSNVASFPAKPAHWFAVARSLFAHQFVGAGQPAKPADPKKGAYSIMEAWLYLVSEAAFRPRPVMNMGTEVILQRGQVMAARSKLAKEWNWSEKKVRGFLNNLVKLGMCHNSATRKQGQQKGNLMQVITIANYERFQNPFRGEGPAKGPATGRPGASQGPESNNSTRRQMKTREKTREGKTFADAQAKAPPVGAAVGGSKASAAPKKNPEGTRLETDWELPADWRQWALNGFVVTNLQVQAEAAAFADWWHSKAGADARKADWEATWRNWIRRKWPEKAQEGAGGGLWWKKAGNVGALTREDWLQRIKQYANGIWPIDKLGPPPGDDECVVPRAIISELKLTEIYTRHGTKREKR